MSHNSLEKLNLFYSQVYRDILYVLSANTYLRKHLLEHGEVKLSF